MAKTKWLLIASLVTMLVAVPLFGACNGEEPPPSDGEEPPPTEYTLYIGGTQSLIFRPHGLFGLAEIERI